MRGPQKPRTPVQVVCSRLDVEDSKFYLRPRVPYHIPLPGMDNKEALVSEATFFRQAPVFKDLSSSYFGVPNLTRRLTDLLVGRIKAALPNIKWEVRYGDLLLHIRNTVSASCPAVDALFGH